MKKQNIEDVFYAYRFRCIQKKKLVSEFFSKKFTTDSNNPTSTQIHSPMKRIIASRKNG